MLVIANLVLIWLESEFGGRKGAASTLGVSSDVLRTLEVLAAKNDRTEES